MTALILIADALDAYRKQLRHHLERSFPSCRIEEVSSMAGLLEAWSDMQPDVILLDTGLGEDRGLRPALDLQNEAPTAKILLLSRYEDDQLRQAVGRIGVAGVVNKILIEKDILPMVGQLLSEEV